MLDKHKQNLDTFKEYLKEHDLSIRLDDFEPKYSLNDEKTVLRFMVLSAVLGYDKPAFEKFAEFVDSQGTDLSKTVKRFERDVKLEVSQLPSVTATVSGKGDLLGRRKSSAKTGYAWLFCYGSNGLTQLEERLERNDFEFYPAVLMKSKLVFAGNSKHWGGGAAAVQEDDKAFVIGAVVKVSKRDLTTLDTYEGVSRSIYTRVHVNVSAFVSPDNNQRARAKAIMYNRVDVIEGTFTLNKPSIKYQHAINKARKEFWADHLDKLKILKSRLAAIAAESKGDAQVTPADKPLSKPSLQKPEAPTAPKLGANVTERKNTPVAQPSSVAPIPESVNTIIAEMNENLKKSPDKKASCYSSFRAIQNEYIAENGDSIFPRTKVKPLQPGRTSTWFIWNIGFPELAKIIDAPYKDSKSAMAEGYIVPARLEGACSYVYSNNNDGELVIGVGLSPYDASPETDGIYGYLIKVPQTEMKKVVSAHEQQYLQHWNYPTKCEYFVTDGNKYDYEYNCVDVFGNKHKDVKFFFDTPSTARYNNTKGGFSDVSLSAKQVIAARSLVAPVWSNMSMHLIDLAESTYKETGVSMFDLTMTGVVPPRNAAEMSKVDSKGSLAFYEVVPGSASAATEGNNSTVKLSKLKRLSDAGVRDAVDEAKATGNIGKYLPHKRETDNIRLLFRFPKPTRSSTPADRVAAYAAQILAHKISNNPFIAVNACSETEWPFRTALEEYVSIEKTSDGSPVPDTSLSTGLDTWISQLLDKDTFLAIGGDWGVFYDKIPRGISSEESQLFIYATKILSEITGALYNRNGVPYTEGKAGDIHKNPAYAREMLTDIIEKLRETPNYSTTSIKSLVALVKKEIDSVNLPMISQEARKQVRDIMDQGLGWFVAQYEEEVRQEYTEQARRAEASMLKTNKGYVICYDARDTFLRMAFDVPKMMDTTEYAELSGRMLSEMVTWIVGYVKVDYVQVERAIENTVQYYSKMLTALFYNRASNKIGRIIDKRMASGGVKKAELLKKDIRRLPGEFPLLTATWRLEFKDKSAFTLGMSVKTNTSSKGKSFFQFPTTFTDVRFKTGRIAGIVSENDMQNIF